MSPPAPIAAAGPADAALRGRRALTARSGEDAGATEPPITELEIRPAPEQGMEGVVTPAAAPEAPVPTRTGRLLPMIIGAALFMQTLDSSIVANALPAMARSLHRDPVSLNLAITAYLVAAAAFLPISAWMSDRFGAKTVFRAAIAGFAVSSLLCGLSQDMPQLVAARMLQGVGGAMMVPVGRAVLLRSVPKSELVRAMTFLTMPALLGPILGPPVGGLIVTFWSWRWIFLMNVPIGIVGIVLATRYVPDLQEPNVGRLDVRGFLLTGAGLAGVVYGLDALGSGGLPPALAVSLLAGSVLCWLLYAVHARRTPHAILDFSLFRIPTFAASLWGGLFSRLLIGGTPFLLALLLQLGFRLSPLQAGLLTFTGAIGAFAMKLVAAPIIRRFGFRQLLLGNALIVAATAASYALFQVTTPHWLLILALLVGGFFRSLQFTALNTLSYADMPQPLMSRASSLASMFQQLAQSLGVGLAAMLIHISLRWSGKPAVTSAEIAPAFVIVALLSLIAMLFFLPLPSNAGEEASGRVAR